MPSILYRLAEALLPDYEVEREIASGGMGSVFAARDVALDRLVAVKIIKPELSTAEAAERFVQEAKVLAQIRHPNVVPVHKAGEAAGFFYYIMDFMEGETLATRLKRGTLSTDEVVNLGRDLLHAIEAVHSIGIVHRDIKPANIFLSGDRALLADFGISRASGPQTAEGQSGEVVSGTPGYMPPEQAFGWDITERTDLYAIAMVLYEALTGRRWETILPEKPADWSGVPRRLAPFLRRALDFDPRMRWPDARSFRRALWRTRTTKYRRRTLMLTLAGLTAGAVAAFLVFGGRGALPHDLVVLPFEVEGGMDRQVGIDLARLTSMSLVTLDPVNFDHSLRLAENGLEPQVIVEQTNAKGWVEGSVSQTADGGLAVRTTVFDLEGNRYEAEDVITMDLGDVECRLGLAVVRAFAAGGSQNFRCVVLEGRSREEVLSLLAGERAFRQQDWPTARNKYREALDHDPTWALAMWRLVNAQRWLRDTWEFDLTDLYHEVGDQLGEQDRMLLDAWQTPFGNDRIRKYEEAVTKYAHDPFTWLVFGDDLLMRGALLGIPTDSAVTIVKQATELYSTLAPAYFDLTWAAMRLGDTAAAAQALHRFKTLGVGEEPVSPAIMEWVGLERFDSTLAAQMRGAAVEQTIDQEGLDLLVQLMRFAPAFDVPKPLARISEGLILIASDHPDGTPAVLADLHTASGLSLVALGLVHAALPHFDAVASILDTPAALLQAAQWRVLLAALAAPPIGEVETEAARQILMGLADRSDVATRAAWTLALDAYARENAMAAWEWVEQVAADTTSESRDLARHLEAVRQAKLGEYDRALSHSAALVPLTTELEPRPEPFLRTALYLSRAQWRTRRNDPEVDGAWLWYENADVEGWPTGLPQSGEIDWAFSTFARFHRGKAALERGDYDLGCPMLRRVLELWANADPAYEPLVNEAEQLTDARCPS